ncbi:MAG: type VI secretion system contractile sheath large subunit [Gemmataceae bacterium]|nr:type VI secretion system contractile sheath large subunit [Gemmataceae bacterium]
MTSNSEAPSHKPAQVGDQPRVRITLDIMVDGVLQRKELPFVVGVLADLSGHPRQPLPPLKERKPVLIDHGNFNEVMDRAGTRLVVRVPNMLTDPNTSLAVELSFRHMDDFEPARVAEQIAPLKGLLEMRRELGRFLSRMEKNPLAGPLLSDILASTEQALAGQRAPETTSGSQPQPSGTPSGGAPTAQQADDPITTEQAAARLLDRLDQLIKETGPQDEAEAERTKSHIRRLLDQAVKPDQAAQDDAERGIKSWISDIDRSLSAQLNEVMHHPDFQKLEGTWRGLHYLVSRTATGETLKIRVLNVTKKELVHDLERAVKFDQTILFKKIHDEVYGWLGGEPYGLVVGDYEFSQSLEDVNLLKMISQIGAAAYAPFVAAASPKMFGIDRFGELPKPGELSKTFDRVEYAAWKSFRQSEDSRFAALTLPRVLARLPYGANFKRVSDFNFEQNVDGKYTEKYAWMSSAWAYAARVTDAVAQWGWMARTRGVEAGGKVEGLPLHNFPTTDGGVALNCPAEIAIDPDRGDGIAQLGFLPLVHFKPQDGAVFMGAASCHKPQKYHDPDATTAAELSAKLNYLLCASRFMHYLRIMARDKIGSSMNAAECQRWLHDWIQSYCEHPDAVAGSAERPLSDARVQIQPVAGKPGWYKLVVDLVPFFQVEDLTAVLRLVSEIPRRG